MKIIYLPLMMLTSIIGFAQESYDFEKIIESKGENKSEIFIKMNEWVASTYNSANDVIQMSDKDAGKLIIKGLKKYRSTKFGYGCYEGLIKYTMKIDVKDEKVRVILTDFIHESINNPACGMGLITTKELHTEKGIRKKYNNFIWDDIKAELNDEFKILTISILEKLKNSQDEEW